jgi:DNA-binding NarL/FixJ family response regulator
MRILIADDSLIFRGALKRLLQQDENQQDWSVCGEAEDGVEALKKIAELSPDILLLDLSIPKLRGLEVAQTCQRDFPSVRVVIMSEQDPSALARMAESAGVQYWIPKSRMAIECIPMLQSLLLQP